MIVACYWCGKLIKRSPGHLKRNTRQFCSTDHYYKWQRTEEGKRVLSDSGKAGGEKLGQIERVTQENRALLLSSGRNYYLEPEGVNRK